jgi:hypothetical protein
MIAFGGSGQRLLGISPSGAMMPTEFASRSADVVMLRLFKCCSGEELIDPKTLAQVARPPLVGHNSNSARF